MSVVATAAKWYPVLGTGGGMRLTRTRDQAISIAREFAAEYDVPWVGVLKVRAIRAWWLLVVEYYQIEIDTGGEGRAEAVIHVPFGTVEHFVFLPLNPDRFWLPLWAAFPTYTAVTMGWRQGSGEYYRIAWCKWFNTLSPEQQAAYQARFPAPDRDAWADFYTWSR